jgi:hypothetical protein
VNPHLNPDYHVEAHISFSFVRFDARAAPRLPNRFATPAGDSMVRRWSEAAAALAADPEADIEGAA